MKLWGSRCLRVIVSLKMLMEVHKKINFLLSINLQEKDEEWFDDINKKMLLFKNKIHNWIKDAEWDSKGYNFLWVTISLVQQMLYIPKILIFLVVAYSDWWVLPHHQISILSNFLIFLVDLSHWFTLPWKKPWNNGNSTY